MNTTELVLYVIILGLVVNLLANMIWKYMPGTEKSIDKIVTCALIVVCALLVVFNNDDSKPAKDMGPRALPGDSGSYSKKAEFITGSEWNMLGGSTGKTFPVKVSANDGKVVTFQMPLGTLDCPVEKLEIVSLVGRVIRIN